MRRHLLTAAGGRREDQVVNGTTIAADSVVAVASNGLPNGYRWCGLLDAQPDLADADLDGESFLTQFYARIN